MASSLQEDLKDLRKFVAKNRLGEAEERVENMAGTLKTLSGAQIGEKRSVVLMVFCLPSSLPFRLWDWPNGGTKGFSNRS